MTPQEFFKNFQVGIIVIGFIFILIAIIFLVKISADWKKAKDGRD